MLTSIKTISDFANADLAYLMLLLVTAIFMNFLRFSSRRSNKFKSQFAVFVGKERLFLVEFLLDRRTYWKARSLAASLCITKIAFWNFAAEKKTIIYLWYTEWVKFPERSSVCHKICGRFTAQGLKPTLPNFKFLLFSKQLKSLSNHMPREKFCELEGYFAGS